MKKSNRALRDVSLVIVFCVGFLALIGLANFLQNDGEQQTSSEFSACRLGADRAAEGHDLNVSLQNLRVLVENDPFDGRAQYELASTLFSRVIEAQDSMVEANRNEPQAPTNQLPPDNQSAPVPSSRDREAELDTLIDQALLEYKLAEQHPRYRSRSQIQLAVLFTFKGDHNEALDTLENFVNDGGATRRGLGQIEQFGSSLHRTQAPTKLHAYSRFSLIVALERINRRGHGGQPSLNWFPALSKHDTNTWNFSKRLNYDLVPYRIKLVNLIRELFE